MQVFGRLGLLLCASALLLSAPMSFAVSPPSLEQVMKGAEQLRDGDPEELLNRQLDKVEQRERAKGDQPKKELTEEDVTTAYRQVSQTAAKEAGNPAKKSGSLFVIIVLGSAFVLVLLCVNLARFAAYRISRLLDQCNWGRPLNHTDVRYSWYYRDAISRFPPPRPSHRR
ncbi:MAG: hypothetical protein ACYDCO_04945 [Armatimonadota bacterium]